MALQLRLKGNAKTNCDGGLILDCIVQGLDAHVDDMVEIAISVKNTLNDPQTYEIRPK